MKKHYEENHGHLCYLCAFSAIYVFIVLFVCVQCYLCVYSVISAVLLMYIQYFFACTMLFMDFYFELFSLNIFNKKPFMPQIRNFLACTYMAFILIRYILALYLPYNLVQAKIDKAKIFQKLFRWWGRKVIMYCIVHFLLLKLHQKSSEFCGSNKPRLLNKSVEIISFYLGCRYAAMWDLRETLAKNWLIYPLVKLFSAVMLLS